ncbi:MAG: hypothetical protein IH934_02010 [Nanoarchaeota archaeon]|nr:hypothetical protein [Nanoarchaeota archaeon]
MTDHDSFYGNLPEDLDYLKSLAQMLKEGKIDEVKELFPFALLPFYDAMWKDVGLSQITGHLIYRLSDFVSEEERQHLDIYGSDDGSIMINERRLDSLEDWRKKWEKMNPYIPELMKILPSGSDISDILESKEDND